jgi:hypothetical protein
MARKGTGESERVGEHSEHPLREMFAMFARTPRTPANNVRLVRYVRTILVPTFIGRILSSGRPDRVEDIMSDSEDHPGDEWRMLRADGTLDTQIGARICKGLAIMRAGLSTFSAPTVNR